jgi:hypothetical protein
MEVLAKKHTWLYAVFTLSAAVGLVVAALGVIVCIGLMPAGALLIVLGLILLISSIVLIVRLIKMPNDLITFKDGCVYFPDYQCNPSDIIDVKYVYYNIFTHWGTLKVKSMDACLTLHFVREVDKVQQKLVMLSEQND